MIEKLQAGRRKTSLLMQSNNETSLVMLGSTKTVGEILQKILA
jgi:hypothetical protein